MADFVGQQFGNYLLTQKLGGGGFADVYLGEHRLLKTQAAIKTMKGQLNEQESQEFLKEAQTIAALVHPNIIRVLEFDITELSDTSRVSFLVMEYAPQGTLRDLHPRGTTIPLPTTLLYIQQVADALQFAHDHKVIHRDVKPENMLIGARGQILLSDFGIAAIAHNTSSLETINTAGTMLYMAPEQWNRKPRPASDQYALGIIAYEWLSGQPPFQDKEWSVLAYQHSSADPPPFASTLGIPFKVEEAIQKALAKDPDQRFPDVKTFAQAFTQNNQVIPDHLGPVSVVPPKPIPTVVAPQTYETMQLDTSQPQASSDTLYREGIKAKAHGDLEQTASLWQQVLTANPDYGNGQLATQMKELLVELHPIRIQRWRKEAENAHSQGAWQQEIAAWNNLLTLQPGDAHAEERIPVAKNNEQCAWMYENAKQLMAEGDLMAVRVQLLTLWQKAPYYGDPAHLARPIRSITVPPSYEDHRAATQQATVLEQAKQREVAALALAKKQAEEARSAKIRARKRFISESAPLPLIYFYLFCTAGGIGASVGMFTQSWIWACAATLLVILLTVFIGYQKALPWFTFIIVGVISIASAFGIATLASLQHYNTPQTDTLWFVGSQLFWIGRQAIAGTILGLIGGLSLGGAVWFFLEEIYEEFVTGLLVFSGILLILVPWLIPYFNSGFGFGPGWPILLLGMAIGLVGGGGVLASIYVGMVALDH